MKTKVFSLYADPGHAWLKVSKDLVRQLFGPDWRKSFTCFSYERENNVYLEEDIDLYTFIYRCRIQDIEPVFSESTTDKYSRIRSYSPLQPIGD
jgi:hypothetical protein